MTNGPLSSRFSERIVVAIGATCITAGGLVAAVAEPLSLHRGSWLAAYLVLVCGVAQIALGIGQIRMAAAAPSRRVLATELIAFNGGNGAVIVGTLLSLPSILDLGGGLLVVALVFLIRGVHGSQQRPHWPLWLFRALIAVVLISIPVGLIIAQLKSA